MLLGQRKRDWQVFYNNEDDKEEPLPSEEIDKKTALDYLYIFDDALYIENINSKKKIYKKDVEKEINKKSHDPYIELAIMAVIGFFMGFILYEKILPSLIVSVIVESLTAVVLLVATIIDELTESQVLKFEEEEEIEEIEKPQRPIRRIKTKDSGKIILLT
jgi:hypothetical protein